MLRISSGELWDLTLEEFDARKDRWEEQERGQNLRFGLTPAVYINSKLKDGYPRVNPGDFFGYGAREISDEEFFRQMEHFAAIHNAQLEQQPS